MDEKSSNERRARRPIFTRQLVGGVVSMRRRALAVYRRNSQSAKRLAAKIAITFAIILKKSSVPPAFRNWANTLGSSSGAALAPD